MPLEKALVFWEHKFADYEREKQYTGSMQNGKGRVFFNILKEGAMKQKQEWQLKTFIVIVYKLA